MSRPYPDYVVANDGLVVGITLDGVFARPDYELGAALQQRNLFFTRLNANEGWDGGGNYGPVGQAAVYVAALRDFAHLSDVSDSVALAFQSLGTRVSNWGAAITQYANDDITQDESDRFTRVGSDQSLFGAPPSFLDNAAAGIKQTTKDLTTPTSWSWATIALVGIGVFAAIELVKSRR
jgi:hypothetical protein